MALGSLARDFTEPQRVWLARIREHLIANLSIDRNDFETYRLPGRKRFRLATNSR